MACTSYDRGLSAHERERWRLWLHACEHRAVLPWVRRVAQLAQAAEEAEAWQSAVATLARLNERLDALDATLWALDPAWAQEVLGRFYALKPDGTADLARRLR